MLWKRQDILRNTMYVFGIPNSIDNNVLEETVRGVFKKIGDEITSGMFKPVIAWNKRKELFSNLLTGKIASKSLGLRWNLNPLTRQKLTFLKIRDFINKNLCPHCRAIWNKCEKLREIQKIQQLNRICGLIRMKLEETGPSKIINHMVHLTDLFPDTDIESLQIFHGIPY